MSDRDWSVENLRQRARSQLGNATNIGGSQNNHQKYVAGDYYEYRQENPNNHIPLKEFLETVEWVKEREQEQAEQDKLTLEKVYLDGLNLAQSDYDELEVTLKDREESIRLLNQELRRANVSRDDAQSLGTLISLFWRRLLIFAAVFLIIGTGLGLWVGWGRGNDGGTASNTSSVGPTTSTIDSKPTTLRRLSVNGKSFQAERVVRRYFELGDKDDADGMLELVTPKYVQEVSLGEVAFREAWDKGGYFKDVDAFISPGREPKVEKAGQEIRVQVAWRNTTSDRANIRTKSYYLRWFILIEDGDVYKINGIDNATPRSCAANDVAHCSQSDRY